MAPFDGMTLRDWFAGQALTGLVQKPYGEPGEWSLDESAEYTACAAYAFADAMLSERTPDGDDNPDDPLIISNKVLP